MFKFYNWQETMSRQTGTNGELCFVLGAKGIGKTFGLRLKCIERYLKARELFCEICRTNAERDEVSRGYFDKLQSVGFFKDYIFKTEKSAGYIAPIPPEGEKPEWSLICYFVSLTNFQREKKRTFMKPKRFIYDEAVIDTKDRYHRYLKDEYLILANLLDSISREQPGEQYQYYVYLLGNAVDLTCPLLRAAGINKLPAFGYSWYKDKTVLLHYVEPWDSKERQTRTLVGRMLAGHEESKVIFDNVFADTTGKEVMKKTPNAQFKFGIVWGKMHYGIWIDAKRGLWFITSRIPKGSKNVYTLTKRDSTINYQMIKKANPLMQLLSDVYYIGGLRYESAHVRESFFEILEFLGIK